MKQEKDFFSHEGFEVPLEFKKITNLGLTNLEPWEILDGDEMNMRYKGLRQRYPSRNLVAFAMRTDMDDIACWDLNKNNEVVLIHDYALPGWEQRKKFTSFWDWFLHATKEMIERQKEDINYEQKHKS